MEQLPVHVLIRDFPEALAALLEEGVDPGARGVDPVGAVLREVPDLEVRLLDALSWRG